jgi:hypothetical protein
MNRAARRTVIPPGAISRSSRKTADCTQEEFMEKLSAERATYQKLLNPTPQ